MEALLHGHPLEFFPGPAPEGPPGGRQQDPFQVFVGVALETLENGTVFAVHRGQTDPGLFHRVHHQAARRHQGLLVGQGNVLPGPDGRQGGTKPRIAHHGTQHRIRFAAGGCGHDPFGTAEDLRRSVVPFLQPFGRCRIRKGRHQGLELPDLGFQQGIVFMGRQRIRSGLAAATSRVWVPMEPVDPNIAIFFMETSFSPAGTG